MVSGRWPSCKVCQYAAREAERTGLQSPLPPSYKKSEAATEAETEVRVDGGAGRCVSGSML